MLHVRPTRTPNHPEFPLCVSVCVKHSLVTLVVWRHNDSEKTPFVHICLYVTYTNKNLVNCSTNELRPYTHKTKFTKRVYTVHSWIKMVSRMTHRRFHVMYRHMNFRVHTPNPDKYPDKKQFFGLTTNNLDVSFTNSDVHDGLGRVWWEIESIQSYGRIGQWTLGKMRKNGWK